MDGTEGLSPTAPKKPCPNPRCPDLSGDCPAHGRTAQRQAYDQARGSGWSRYGGTKWAETKALVKARDPVCTWGSLPRYGAPSGSCPEPTNTAAHVVARRDGGSDEPENCRGLCAQHHAVETSRGESWNRAR